MSKQVLTKELYRVFADSYAVYLKTQNYHWNVTGPSFSSLHGLFEEQYSELADALDTLAERLRTFDIRVKAGFKSLGDATSIIEGAEEASATEMLKDLIASLEVLLQTIRTAQKAAQEAGDTATEDLLVSRTIEHEKALWMLKSSL
jgi:starvation-inducible DNA-binding protein